VRTKRSLFIPVAVTIVLVAAIATTTQCGSRSPAAHSPTPRWSPVPISLALPTTIHLSTMTNGGAYLAKPTRRARVTLSQALAMNDFVLPPERTQSVLANVTWPSEFYKGKPIRGLTCWVVVYTLPQLPNRIGPVGKTPAPVMVQHSVTILDARTGADVRGFFTK
jgi:hypothetical protein